MTLAERIREDLKTAMKARDSLKTGTIRMLLAELKKREIDGRKTLSDEELTGVIKSGIKSRHESVEAFRKGNREELAAKELQEIEILSAYLPRQLSPAELEEAVAAAIAETGAASGKDIGKVMKAVLAKHGSAVDGKAVNAVVLQKLK